jgi:hypothetical protein
MTQVIGTVMTLKVIIDTIARRSEVGADTRVTLTQEMIDATDRELQAARESQHPSKFEDVSIGAKVYQERCDLECGNRIATGAARCRHGRMPDEMLRKT